MSNISVNAMHIQRVIEQKLNKLIKYAQIMLHFAWSFIMLFCHFYHIIWNIINIIKLP